MSDLQKATAKNDAKNSQNEANITDLGRKNAEQEKGIKILKTMMEAHLGATKFELQIVSVIHNSDYLWKEI